MNDPTARVLQLLSLLQTYKFWSGDELAGRLGVSGRTLRRDIDRLRELGYPVDATPGVAGGYRLTSGAHMPPQPVGQNLLELGQGPHGGVLDTVDGGARRSPEADGDGHRFVVVEQQRRHVRA